jgi:uncharacterized BrkB/YihY/UPF0761 family membrane protein
MTRPPGRRLVEAGRVWLANSLGARGYRRIREIDLDTHALALCAQQVLCTAPLVVAGGAVLQRLTGREPAYFLTRFFGLHDDSAKAVDHLFSRTASSVSTLALLISLVLAVVFTTTVAAVQQRAFEMIWTLPRLVGLRSSARQFVWAVMLVVYATAMLLPGRISGFLEDHIGWPADFLVAIMQGAGTFLYYWWSQRWLLAGRIKWRALLPGAACVGVATTGLFRLTRVALPGQISWQVHAYGQVGAVFMLSVWLMALSVVIFGGVLVGALVTERRAERFAFAADDAYSPLTPAGLRSVEGLGWRPLMADDYERELAAASTIARVGEIVRKAARRLTSADGATFVLRDGDLCFYADEDAIGPLWKGQRFPMTQCISGWAMLHKESVTVPDIERDDRIPLAAYRPTFVRSLVMVPINREQPVGAIGAYWSWTGLDSTEPVKALEKLAAAAAEAIDRIGLDDAPWAPNFSVPGGATPRQLQND